MKYLSGGISLNVYFPVASDTASFTIEESLIFFSAIDEPDKGLP